MATKAEQFLRFGISAYPKPFKSTFTIFIDPRGKSRGRIVAPGGQRKFSTGNLVVSSTPKNAKRVRPYMVQDKKTKTWEGKFANLCKVHAPTSGKLLGPLLVDIIAFFERPKYMKKSSWPDHPIWKSTTPDQDNVRKIVLDAMNRSKVWWNDDRQIVAGQTVKLYVERDGEPRVVVRVQELGGVVPEFCIEEEDPMQVLCQYCDEPAKFVDSANVYSNGQHYGYLWYCDPCKAWVGCHKGTRAPLGTLANAQLRANRQAAHKHFDRLWRSGAMERTSAYAALAENLGVPHDECHIAMFDDEQCRQVIAWAKEMMDVAKSARGLEDAPEWRHDQ